MRAFLSFALCLVAVSAVCQPFYLEECVPGSGDAGCCSPELSCLRHATGACGDSSQVTSRYLCSTRGQGVSPSEEVAIEARMLSSSFENANYSASYHFFPLADKANTFMASVHWGSMWSGSEDTALQQVVFRMTFQHLVKLTGSAAGKRAFADVDKFGDDLLSGATRLLDSHRLEVVAHLERTADGRLSAHTTFMAREGGGIPSHMEVLDEQGALLHAFDLPEAVFSGCGSDRVPAICSVTTPDNLDGSQNHLALGLSPFGISDPVVWTKAPSLTIDESTFVPLSSEFILPTAAWTTKVAFYAGRALFNFRFSRDDEARRQMEQRAEELSDRLEALDKQFHESPPKTQEELIEGYSQELQLRREAESLVKEMDPILLGKSDRLAPLRKRLSVKAEAPLTIQEYKDMFRWIPTPNVAETFQTDDQFVFWRLSGPNPMIIEGITKSELVALVGDRISDEMFNSILGTSGDTVETAGAEGRLYVCNYEALSATVPVLTNAVVAPIAVFAEPAGGKFVKPVGIQLGQALDDELVMANTFDLYRWIIAKTVVQAADFAYHELVVHLGWTHLVMEAFTTAMQRNLQSTHVVRRLLEPHTEGTLFINHLAATMLIASGGQIDTIFSGESGATAGDRLKSLQAVAVTQRLGFDWQARMPDRLNPSRNIDRMKVFPYRDDSLRVFYAIHNWTTAYVNLYYSDDAAVVNDQQLRSFAADVLANGRVKGWTIPQNRSGLARDLAMMAFTASAQHAAVNFPQKSQEIFPPAYPGGLWADLPSNATRNTELEYLAMLPPTLPAKTQVEILYLLGSVYYRRLGEYKQNNIVGASTLLPNADLALVTFNAQLQQVESEIKMANEERGFLRYTSLLPSEIPASINI